MFFAVWEIDQFESDFDVVEWVSPVYGCPLSKRRHLHAVLEKPGTKRTRYVTIKLTIMFGLNVFMIKNWETCHLYCSNSML